MLTKSTSAYISTLTSIGIASDRGDITLLVVKAFVTLIGSVSPIIGSW